MNEYGIMHGSILVVQIHEARDLVGGPTAYAEVIFENQRQATQAKPTSNRPAWNEKFSFDVVTGNEKVVINVCTSEFAGRRILGSCSYDLKALTAPDYTYDNWLALKAKSGQVVGQIKASLQWIISRVDFFNNIINKIEKEIIDSKNELGFYTEKLKILHGSFCYLFLLCLLYNNRAFRIP